MYLELLKKYKDEYNFKLFSFALMPSRLNLLLELNGPATISMIMHDAASAYTKYFNNRYQRKGHLFRERFKSIVVEKGPYLTQLISYMHLAAAKSVPAKGIYSSHNLYLYYSAASKTEMAGNVSKILDLKKEIEEVHLAIAKNYPDKITYADFIACVTEDEIENLRKKLQGLSILGSGEFIDKVKAQIENRSAAFEKKNKLIMPVVSITIIVLLAGVGLGVLYIQKIQKDFVQRQKKIDEVKPAAVKKEEIAVVPAAEKKVIEQMPLVELDGTQWTIEARPRDKAATPAVYFDKLQFKGHMLSSKEMAVKGFQPSNYTLTVQNDGTLLWETMQRNAAGGVIFWQGQTTKDNKMSGIMSTNSADGKSQDVLFTSVGFWRKE